MNCVCDVQNQLLGPEGICIAFKALVEAVATQNQVLIARLRLPKMYEVNTGGRVRVRFRNEPWAGKFEEIATAVTVLKRGWGDCDDLAAWRIAELRIGGIAATCKVYVREHKLGKRKLNLYHVEVRLPDGSVEDPARYLGM